MSNNTEQSPHKRQLSGIVVSKSGIRTVAVEIVRVAAHPIYGKRMHRTKRYLAHDATDILTVGQKVTIQESRPLSARKRWIVISSQGESL